MLTPSALDERSSYRVPRSSLDDLTLVAEAARGEAARGRELFLRLAPVVQRRVRRRFASHARAFSHVEVSDLVQEVWLALLRDQALMLRRWDPARGATLEGYAAMVTDRELSNLRKRASAKRRRAWLDDVDRCADQAGSDRTPEAMLISRDAIVRTRELLHTALPPRGRAMLEDLCAHDFVSEDVAQSARVERQVVYNWQHRIRKLAREIAGHLRDVDPKSAPSPKGMASILSTSGTVSQGDRLDE